MLKIKEFFTNTFVGRLVPYMAIAIGLGIYSPFQVILLISFVGIGIWLLCSIIAHIRIPPDDDGGSAGTLVIYAFNFGMIKIALWASFGISHLYKAHFFS